MDSEDVVARVMQERASEAGEHFRLAAEKRADIEVAPLSLKQEAIRIAQDADEQRALVVEWHKAHDDLKAERDALRLSVRQARQLAQNWRDSCVKEYERSPGGLIHKAYELPWEVGPAQEKTVTSFNALTLLSAIRELLGAHEWIGGNTAWGCKCGREGSHGVGRGPDCHIAEALDALVRRGSTAP